MRLPNLLPLLALLPLQACITTTFHDTMLKSQSRAPLPLGAIHVPPRDSGILLQGSLQVSQGFKTSANVTPYLEKPLIKQESQTSSLEGTSNLQLPAQQFAAQGSLFLSDHVRLGLFVDGTPSQHALWGELGLRFGHELSIETFVGAGTVPVQSTAEWISTSTSKGCDSSLLSLGMGGGSTWHCIDDTAHQFLQTSKDQDELMLRAGFHLGLRKGGPWIEAQAGAFTLLPTSPMADAKWGASILSASVGWAQPTDYGTATVALRAVGIGDTFVPSASVQWTGEIKLGG